jgi:p-cumate 2,3-dioxygenase subunit beta
MNSQPVFSRAGDGAAAAVTRAQVEDFLYEEAELLDAWELERWTALFTDDAEYLVPPLDAPEADPRTTLFLVYDDRHRLAERARRLLSRSAHSEFPRSRTRHLYGNVRIVGRSGDTITATCNFIVHRARGPVNDVYPGRSTYLLVRTPDGLRIRSKRAMLDLVALRPQGKISIIL